MFKPGFDKEKFKDGLSGLFANCLGDVLTCIMVEYNAGTFKQIFDEFTNKINSEVEKSRENNSN
jgi:hypothetical protein